MPIDYDIVVGREVIKSENLVAKLPCQFLVCNQTRDCPAGCPSMADVTQTCQACNERNARILSSVNNYKPEELNSMEVTKPGTIVAKESLLKFTDDLATPELDAYLQDERVNPNLVDPLTDEAEILSIRKSDGSKVEIAVHGTSEVRKRIGNILQKYADLFCNELPKEPANLPAFTIEVDKSVWNRPQNRTAPRPQTWAKSEEIRRSLDEMLELGVIEPSDAAYYSQVHLVAKPDNTWRFCIDYRNLNNATKHITNWPLPYIRDLLYRIGQRKATIFGVMDFKSGYHQLGVDQRCREYLAFITAFGIFTFLRLPFGP